MKGQKIGYIRVSTPEQNPDRQLVGLELDKKFIDNFTGRILERPALSQLREYIREGDELFVHSMDRLARNMKDLRNLVDEFQKKSIKVHFVKENISFAGYEKPMDILLLSLIGAFAEFEFSIVKERQMEGIRLAKLKGLYKGRKKVFNEERFKEVVKRIQEGHKMTKIANEFNVSREVIYKYLKIYGLSLDKIKKSKLIESNL